MAKKVVKKVEKAVKGFCMKCKAKQVIEDVKLKRFKNGRQAYVGTCGTCGTKMFRFSG